MAVPRAQVTGIDMNPQRWNGLCTRKHGIRAYGFIKAKINNNVLGILHMRQPKLRTGMTVESNERDVRDFILANMRRPAFCARNYAANAQLSQFFKEEAWRTGLVADGTGVYVHGSNCTGEDILRKS